MDDHVGKPFELDHLIATLHRLVAQPQGAVGHAPAPHGDTPTQESPPLPASQAAPHPPALDGWEVDAALQRMGNDEAIFGSVLRSFARDMALWPSQLQTAQHTGSTDEVARALHTYKGLAATVGASALSRSLQALERKVKAQSHGVDCTEVAQALSEAVEQAQRALGTVLLRWEGGADLASHGAVPAHDGPDHLRSILLEMQVLLDASDLRVLEVFAQLRPQLGARLSDWSLAMDNALQAFDFAQAAQLCESALAEHPDTL